MEELQTKSSKFSCDWTLRSTQLAQAPPARLHLIAAETFSPSENQNEDKNSASTRSGTVAVMAAYANDPLLAFRHALAASVQPIITTSPTPASENTTGDLSIATHLHFPAPVSQTYPLSTPTRFVSAAAGAQTPIDLRSIYFAWLKRDVAIPEYIAEAQQINEALAVNGTTDTTEQPATAKSHKPAAVVNLVFVERLSLITWLEGLSEEAEKEYIKPLGPAPGVSAPSASLDAAHHVTDGGGAGTAGTGADAAARDAGPVDGKTAKAIDPALQVIYDGERKMGDRNSVLRGVRPTVGVVFPISPLYSTE